MAVDDKYLTEARGVMLKQLRCNANRRTRHMFSKRLP